jgi:hypothetical protein
MAEFRGDNRMKWAVTPEEHRPVTIDDVISPVPMNPNRMILSDRFQRKRAQLLNVLERCRLFISILSDERRELTVGESSANRKLRIRSADFRIARHPGGTAHCPE